MYYDHTHNKPDGDNFAQLPIISRRESMVYNMNDGITIRALTDYNEFLACETIQRLAWKMTDDRDIVPAHMLKPVADHGGIVLGAFDEDSELIGFVFGFIGTTKGARAGWMGSRYIFCSEMMGILPEYRSRSVGYRLKLAQRDYALEQGYSLMIWTYDPLLSLNANLNINKLGCIARHYVRDAYGEMGGIYAGLSTDRFSVEWWIGSRHVSDHLKSPENTIVEEQIRRSIPIANTASHSSNGLLRPETYEIPDTHQFLVEFPSDIQGIKQTDMGLAIEWRAQTRALFEEAFEEGFAVSAFARGIGERKGSSFYLLSSELDIPSMARGEA
jgi:predicted GNAT superfamily acetyltransferase